MLYTYLKTTEGFLRDRRQGVWEPEDLIGYINRARREIAYRSQCIRRVPPISGGIESITVTAGGEQYFDPIVTISAPDQPLGEAINPNGAQATATVQQIGGVISNISVNFGGAGYRQPIVTISDSNGGDGFGATATAVVAGINQMNANQERYDFADFPLQGFPGVKSCFAVIDVSILYNNLRYRLLQYSFSEYQAFIRNYPFQYSYVPVAYTIFQAGTNGSLLVYPFPSQTYAWEPDCLCVPIDLQTDQDYEALGEPWSEAVPYLAAAYAYEEGQNYNSARYWNDKFREFVNRYGNYANPRMIANPYGRR